MNTFPLTSLTVEEAAHLQFRIVDAATRHLHGAQALHLGGLGLDPAFGAPEHTRRVEGVFADVFDAEAALFVRGAGTGALRWALASVLRPGDALLVHDAPIYPTTKTTLEQLGVTPVPVNFNDPSALSGALRDTTCKAALVQHTRQKIDDSYDFGGVVETIKALRPHLPVVTDDNYAALKVPHIGCGYGADLATFSCFKTLGPEGVGVILGREAAVAAIAKLQYSGGSQVQGHEAMSALRGIIYAPVALALSAQVSEAVCDALNSGILPEVKGAFLVNAQSKVIVVEFHDECAEAVLRAAPRHGGAPYPVGCESIYEFAPLFYRVSGTFRAQDPTLERRMIRINPLRAGCATVLRILRAALSEKEG